MGERKFKSYLTIEFRNDVSEQELLELKESFQRIFDMMGEDAIVKRISYITNADISTTS